ncbi:class II fructose-bisphosphate aldolase [Paractinoplanes brasiliensis]|uniref:Fructose-bisphosphate aldolase class II n=1 Tax=Paractinoplanes brasiliensis TaxID=52695 RepID=A0A4R6K3Q0_9ACTN|nr:class II fructose-bisphosphate aldolase [Actinoplanes brasiliensis]TDO41855.1 fructose-bisphosphate aldolase class II [Actinoplanes brasiliensis]GID29867.1 fructose-bisphosphate aldolase [Actinoplanes brasiliensis]
MTKPSIVEELRGSGRGIGAFNVITLEHAEAVVGGAEDAGLPVILQISQNAVRYHGSLAPIAAACLSMAGTADVPVVVHLDHAEDETLIDEAIELGLPSVMFDAATLPYAENVARTRAVTERCHAAGCWVEAELGAIGGKDGVHAPGVRTDPAEAAGFVAATGVDALAVAVGSAHAMASRDAVLDDRLIERLAAAVPVPLVLHGSSGVPDDGLRRAVAHGIVKVNVGTLLNRAMTGAVREVLAARADLTDPRKYLAPGRAAVRGEVARTLTLLAGEQSLAAR